VFEVQHATNLGPVSQNYLITKIYLKIRICHEIVIRFIIAVSQNFHIISYKSNLKICLMTNFKILLWNWPVSYVVLHVFTCGCNYYVVNYKEIYTTLMLSLTLPVKIYGQVIKQMQTTRLTIFDIYLHVKVPNIDLNNLSIYPTYFIWYSATTLSPCTGSHAGFLLSHVRGFNFEAAKCVKN
jgi:hypothetical protein